MKGIPFSPEMALALREGRKYETRRVINPQPTFNQVYDWKGKRLLDTSCRQWCWKHHVFGRYPDEWMPQLAKLAKYNVGDVCYVQETWAVVNYDGCLTIAYKADGATKDDDLLCSGKRGIDCGPWYYDLIAGTEKGWKSPRFMPAWAARTFVEITSVRVERVRDISIHAALLEGLRCPDCGYTSIDAGFHMDHGICVNRWLKRAKAGSEEDHSLIASFRELWNRLHPKAPYRFEDDPWVWVHGLKEVPRP